MSTRQKSVVYAALILALALFGIYFGVVKPAAVPVIENGVLDLSGYSGLSLPLTGEVEFFWDKLIVTEEREDDPPDMMVSIPADWRDTQLNGSPLPLNGKASYRFTIKNDAIGILDFEPSLIFYPTNVWVDGQLAMFSGVVEDEKSYYDHCISAIFIETEPGAESVVVFEVANLDTPQGGLFRAPMLFRAPDDGMTTSHLWWDLNITIDVESGILYILILFSAFSILSFGMKRPEPLVFALFTLVLVFVFGKHTILYDFGPQDARIRNQFLPEIAAYLSVAVLILLMAFLFPKAVSKRVWFGLGGLSVCSALSLLLVGVESHHTVSLLVLGIHTIILGLLCFLSGRCICRGEPYALIWGVGFTFFAYGVLWEQLFWLGAVRYLGATFSVATLAFTLSIVALLAIRYRNTVKLANQTYRLSQEAYRAKLAALGQVKPTFLMSALDLAAGHCGADPKASANLLTELSHFLRFSFESKQPGERVSIHDELESVSSLWAVSRHGNHNLRIVGERDFTVPRHAVVSLVESLLSDPDMQSLEIDITQVPDGATLRFTSESGIPRFEEAHKAFERMHREDGCTLTANDRMVTLMVKEAQYEGAYTR